jgi:hypothetical protein
MYLVYVLAVVSLKAAYWVSRYRTNSLFSKFCSLDSQSATLEATASDKESSLAKMSGAVFALGQVVAKRDSVEARYAKSEALSNRLSRIVEMLTGWRNRNGAYTLGIADASATWVALIGLGLVDPTTLARAVDAVKLTLGM